MAKKARKKASERTNVEALEAKKLEHTANKLDRSHYPTPDEFAVLEGYITAGNHLTTACKAAGVSWDRFHRWREAAIKGDPLLRDFLTMIERAESAAEMRALAIVTAAAEGAPLQRTKTATTTTGKTYGETETVVQKDWRAAAFILEHRFQERYARMRKLQHSGVLTHRQVIVLHDGDPSLELEQWDEDTEAPTDADFEVQDDDADTETYDIAPSPDGEG